MCFGKKAAAYHPDIAISEVRNISIIPPWEIAYPIHTTTSIPVQPRSYHHANYTYQRVPAPGLLPRSAGSYHGERHVVSPTQSIVSGKRTKWFRVNSGKIRIFKNAGLNDRGRLRLDYEEIEDVDWGEPTEYRRKK